MRSLFPLILAACTGSAVFGASAASAGELTVFIRPDTGSAWIITYNRFQVCVNQGRDPWSRSRCPGWRSLVNGTHSRTGYYCVQAAWGNAIQYRQSLDMRIGIPRYTLNIKPQNPVSTECL